MTAPAPTAPTDPPRRPTTLTRSGFLVGGLAAGLLLVGCGGGGDGSADDASDEGGGSGAAPAAEGAGRYPLELGSGYGSTTLAARPERIAVISPATVDTDALVALGVLPVLAPDTVELEPWTPEAAREGVEIFWSAGVGALPSAEEVLASSPDLIVALQAPDTFGQEDFDKLASIAPVLLPDAGSSLSWQDITTRLGEVLDLGEAASTLISDVEAKIDEIAARNPDFAGKSAAHVHVYSQEYGAAFFSFPGSDSEKLLGRLGFEPAPHADRFTADNYQISDELVSTIDADVLLVTANPSPEGAGWFTETPLFQAVPAVADGRWALYEPEESETFAAFAWAIRMQSPLSLPWAAAALEELAVDALG
ncbi:ABC transporter substrate-binding protein [Brachybacterium paraconglomeratum]|uniref:ABC transporter substrate-binding protein n=1 Tax=Brachybacterium paraconglomeratum TaxID=173362 RepID=UPI003FD00F7C